MPHAPRRFALLSTVAIVALTSPAVAATTESTIDLTPRVLSDDLAEVTLELQVGGTMSVPKDGGASAETTDLPMSVAAKLVYDELRFAPATGARATRSVRWYKDAGATIKVDNDGKAPTLADARRLVVVDNPGGRLVHVSPTGLLERAELDLIDVAGDSLAVDGLLPDEPVANGATWNARPDAIASLLSLDTVASCEVQSVLDKFNADFALVRVAGSAFGSIDGAATEIELRGIYLFDRKLRRISRCNLAVKEQRSIGGATPGLDSVAKLRLNVRPIDQSEHLTAATVDPLRQRANKRLDLLRLDAANQGFRVIHDRRWFITSRDRESTTLRRVEGPDVVAHCTITALPAKSAGRQTSLVEFEQDIRRSLGDHFGELVASRQWINAFRHHCFEVVVRGTTQEVPVEWHYFLIAPESGERVSVTVTIDGQMVDRLANADRKLVNAIQLVGTRPADTKPVANRPTGPLSSVAPAHPAKSPAVHFARPAGTTAAANAPPVNFATGGTPQRAAPIRSASAANPPAVQFAPQRPQEQRDWTARAGLLHRSLMVPAR